MPLTEAALYCARGISQRLGVRVVGALQPLQLHFEPLYLRLSLFLAILPRRLPPDLAMSWPQLHVCLAHDRYEDGHVVGWSIVLSPAGTRQRVGPILKYLLHLHS